MSFRNLSPQRMFEAMALEHVPSARFAASTAAEAEAWRSSTLPEVLTTLGRLPERVQLNSQLLGEWEEGSILRQRWLIDVDRFIAAVVYVNVPLSLAEGEAAPAIFCWHGHGDFGKSPVMGPGASEGVRASVAQHNYNYGYQMAERGFVTYAIDWIGRGDRDDTSKPNWRAQGNGDDWCNLYYLNATMLGMTSLGINVTHGIAATDFVASLPQVDGSRLGVMGLSGGGTMALWSSLCDERLLATEIICYSDLWAHFGFRDLNYCGMQVAPGLYSLVDLPDLQGLLAPRPLLVDIGAEDTTFLIDSAMACYRQVEHIYDVAGAQDRLELDLFPGGHAWGDNKSEAFFRKWLG